MKESNPMQNNDGVCAPLEEQNVDENNKADDFDDNYSHGDTWLEMSWRKYKDNLLDYGEESEWDKFLEEEEIFYS